MNFDFTPYFKKYEQLRILSDQVFDQVRSKFPDSVTCKPFCADCCFAVFDLTLIEAVYINHQIRQDLGAEAQAELLVQANKADREVYRYKKEAVKAVEAGASESAVVERFGRARVRCPLLNDENMCRVYASRPLTCRFYGIPVAVGGKARVCGKSAFELGAQCPAVNVDAMHQRLLDLSREMAMDIGGQNKVDDVLVPLSMALLNNYDEAYFGLPVSKQKTGGDDSE